LISFLSSAADGANEMHSLPPKPRAGNRRDTLMNWPHQFFDTLLQEALASDVLTLQRSNMFTGKYNLNVQNSLII